MIYRFFYLLLVWNFYGHSSSLPCNAMRDFIPIVKQNVAYHPKHFTPLSMQHQVNCTGLLKNKYCKCHCPTNTNLNTYIATPQQCCFLPTK